MDVSTNLEQVIIAGLNLEEASVTLLKASISTGGVPTSLPASSIQWQHDRLTIKLSPNVDLASTWKIDIST